MTDSMNRRKGRQLGGSFESQTEAVCGNNVFRVTQLIYWFEHLEPDQLKFDLLTSRVWCSKDTADVRPECFWFVRKDWIFLNFKRQIGTTVDCFLGNGPSCDIKNYSHRDR